jgi:arsenate reductase
MGCEEACPLSPGTRNQEWPVPDPAGKPIEVMREIRNEVEERVRRLIEAEKDAHIEKGWCKD